MESKLVIFCTVDVIAALSTRTLQNGNLCMMDNGTSDSLHQGTPDLCTKCYRGQLIEWTIVAVDLQTPVAIRNITILGPYGAYGSHDNSMSPSMQSTHFDANKLHLPIWSGFVPWHMVPGVAYRYRLELQMYEGRNSIMSVDTPALMCV